MPAPAFIFKQAVSVEAYQGETGAGGPAFAAAVTVRAHVEPTQRLVTDAQGVERMQQAWMIVPVGTVIPPESRVTWNGRRFRVVGALDMVGPDGKPHHIEVSLGVLV